MQSSIFAAPTPRFTSSRLMPLRLLSSFCFLLVAVSLAACTDDSAPAESSAPAGAPPPAVVDTVTVNPLPEVEPERLRAFEMALDSLDALVRTLERIEGPVAAWNQAGEAARLLTYLEKNRNAFALDMTKAEAAQRYPAQIGRLNALEARRAAELQRINEDPVATRVLMEEMAKAAADTMGP
jgi:hypothetical protein